MTSAAALITMALVFYSLGVWAERLVRYLRPWHVVAFWTGFLFDISGTWAMHRLAERPFDLRVPHTLTGQIALWLMLAHAVWATRVAQSGSEEARRGFHRYSLLVWLIWLVPYFGGMYLGMKGVPDLPPAAVVPSPRQVEYQRMELIGFLHFTVNTFTDREWGYGDESPRLFAPTELDARQWVTVAEEAGMKEFILTARHHDGFALWRDPVRPPHGPGPDTPRSADLGLLDQGARGRGVGPDRGRDDDRLQAFAARSPGRDAAGADRNRGSRSGTPGPFAIRGRGRCLDIIRASDSSVRS